MNMFMSVQIFINEKGQIEGLKDGCLSYLEKPLALKDNTLFYCIHLPLRHWVNKLFSIAFLNKPGKVLSCKNDAKYGAGWNSAHRAAGYSCNI